MDESLRRLMQVLGGTRRPRAADVYGAAGIGEQVRAFDTLDLPDKQEVAGYQGLFDLSPAIVGRCLNEMTETVLSNRSCPPALLRRIRHPYDEPTLELAVRAGPKWFEVAQVRRLIQQLEYSVHERFMTELRLPYLTARNACGLNTLEELLHGRLAGLDLADQAIAKRALGWLPAWNARQDADELIEILIHHPQASHLKWIFDGVLPGGVTPEWTRRAMARYVPGDRPPSDQVAADKRADSR